MNVLPAVIAILGNLSLIIGAVLGNSPLVVVAIEVFIEFSNITFLYFSVAKVGVSVGVFSSNVVTAYASPISIDPYKFDQHF